MTYETPPPDRINRISRLLFEQGRLLAERRDRQDFFAAARRSRRLKEIKSELDRLRITY